MSIPKNIHISWPHKNLLESDSIFVKNCIGGVVNLATGWNHVIHDDSDVDCYLKENISKTDYDLLIDRHIVEKIDLWRLIKLYNEGGLYLDIDRLCDTSINDIIKPETKLVLPTCAEHDFSQDFMCSAPNNPIFKTAIDINLSKRRLRERNVYLLGPQTYFEAVLIVLFGEVDPSKSRRDYIEEARSIIKNFEFIETYREYPPITNILFRGSVNFDYEEEKRKFYYESGIKHWTGQW